MGQPILSPVNICVYLPPLLCRWRYHEYLRSITLAGSHAKGTDLQDSDVDIFLRLSHVTPGPLSAIQTSLADHLHGHVRNSGLIDEILALKIWRRRHALRFPSFLMELATIHARPKDFRALLHFLATDFPTTRLLDPANSNNVVSDLLTEVEKLRIARRAEMSLGAPFPKPPDHP